MKKLIIIFVVLLVIASMQMVIAVGNSTGISIVNDNFKPLVWLCDNRVLLDDNTGPGRYSNGGEELVERINNYAFEGEQIVWKVLVMDKNGIDKISDVYGTLGDQQGVDNPIEVNCLEDFETTTILPSCNARIQQEYISQFDSAVMRYYDCKFSVETSEDKTNMYGEKWFTVEVEDIDKEKGVAAENEYWFLNPVVAISVSDKFEFNDAMPGTDAYSNTILVGNEADDSSGVMMDMFISGTDFYDSSSSGAMCPDSNKLALSNFRYYSTNGAYSTYMDKRADNEGYVPIRYGIGFNNPIKFYGISNSANDTGYEIMHTDLNTAGYFIGNILAPGAKMPITFKLSMPEPCNGDFDTGNIYFWGEAI